MEVILVGAGQRLKQPLAPPITKTADLTIQNYGCCCILYVAPQYRGLTTDGTRHDRNLDQSMKGFDS